MKIIYKYNSFNHYLKKDNNPNMPSGYQEFQSTKCYD